MDRLFDRSDHRPDGLKADRPRVGDVRLHHSVHDDNRLNFRLLASRRTVSFQEEVSA